MGNSSLNNIPFRSRIRLEYIITLVLMLGIIRTTIIQIKTIRSNTEILYDYTLNVSNDMKFISAKIYELNKCNIQYNLIIKLKTIYGT